MRLVTGGRYQGKSAYAGRIAGPAFLVLDAAQPAVRHMIRKSEAERFFKNCKAVQVLDHCEVLTEELLDLLDRDGLAAFLEAAENRPEGDWSIDQIHGMLKMIFDKIRRENPDIIFVMAEMGCGVVPIDRRQDRLREHCGRIACALAREAETVDRLICGLPQRIKG